MATVKEVGDAALKRILVQGAGAELEPEEYKDFIFALNNLMFALDADSISLGYSRVYNLGDEVTVPTGALRGIIANVAIEVAPEYGGKVSPALVAAASAGMDTIRKLGQRIPTSKFPGNLPRGRAQGSSGLDPWGYYPDLEAEILAETTGAIGLEVDTNNQ